MIGFVIGVFVGGFIIAFVSDIMYDKLNYTRVSTYEDSIVRQEIEKRLRYIQMDVADIRQYVYTNNKQIYG